MILIDGIAYQIINVLFLLIASAGGATPVAGTNGTNGAFLNNTHAQAAQVRNGR